MRDKYDTSVVDNKYNPHVLRIRIEYNLFV